jgi:hypothetical protein
MSTKRKSAFAMDNGERTFMGPSHTRVFPAWVPAELLPGIRAALDRCGDAEVVCVRNDPDRICVVRVAFDQLHPELADVLRGQGLTPKPWPLRTVAFYDATEPRLEAFVQAQPTADDARQVEIQRLQALRNAVARGL